MVRTVFSFLAVLVTLVGASDCLAQTFSKIHLQEKPTRLLGGRLQIRLPKGARAVTRRTDVGYPDLETRVTYENGGEQMLIVVQELLALAPNDFEGAVKKIMGGQKDLKVQRLSINNKTLRVYAVWPDDISAGQEANLMLTLFVGQRDRTVQLVTFFVNGTAAANPGAARVLVKRVAHTLAAGGGTLDFAGGEKTLTSPEGGSVRLSLPKNTVVTRDSAMDSVVFTFHRLVRLGQPPAGNLGIVLGGEPVHRFKKVGAETTEVDGRLLGAVTKWYTWSMTLSTGAQATIVESIGDPRVGGEVLPIHVFMSADDETALEWWRKVANTLTKGI